MHYIRTYLNDQSRPKSNSCSNFRTSMVNSKYVLICRLNTVIHSLRFKQTDPDQTTHDVTSNQSLYYMCRPRSTTLSRRIKAFSKSGVNALF